MILLTSMEEAPPKSVSGEASKSGWLARLKPETQLYHKMLCLCQALSTSPAFLRGLTETQTETNRREDPRLSVDLRPARKLSRERETSTSYRGKGRRYV